MERSFNLFTHKRHATKTYTTVINYVQCSNSSFIEYSLQINIFQTNNKQQNTSKIKTIELGHNSCSKRHNNFSAHNAINEHIITTGIKHSQLTESAMHAVWGIGK
jgi:hypothetical protein